MAFLAVLVLGVAAIVIALNLRDSSPAKPVHCAATLDGTDWYLSTEQADNAALISAVAMRRGLPARAATICLLYTSDAADE